MSLDESGFTLTWQIENFSMLPYQTGKYLKSPSFKVHYWDNVKWHLEFFPRGETITTEGCLDLFLYKSGDQDVTATVSFVLESLEPPDIKKTYIKKFNSSYCSSGCRNFCKLNEIFDKRNSYLPQDVLTIHCHMYPENKNTEALNLNNELAVEDYFLGNSLIRTTIPVNRRFVLWDIEDVTTIEDELEEISPLIAIQKSLPKFSLTLDFTDVSSNGFLPIEIDVASLDEGQEVFVNCKIQVVNTRTEFRDSKESSYFFDTRKDNAWTFPEFLKANNLKRDKYIFIDDTLYLQFELSYSYPGTEYHTEDNRMPLFYESKATNCTSDLVISIQKCYQDGTFCDVQLVAGAETFPAHKLILSARSPVFSAMFENEMKEKNTGVIEIDDINPPTLKRLLTYLHSDILDEDLSIEKACKLYQAADKYDIEPLRRRCSIRLMSGLSVANLCNVLVIADAHRDDFLMTSVHYFIRCHASEVFHSKQWEELADCDSKLAAKVMLKYLRH